MNYMNIELLEKAWVLEHLHPAPRARLDELVVLNSVDSTMDYLLRLTQQSPEKQVIACFAEQQTAGKGQRGKSWLSPPGQIYFSILWPFHKPANQIMGLSLAIGVAVARTLHQYGVGNGVQLKWPNDVYYQSKKLAGILVETAQTTQDTCRAVIGIGINLYLTDEQAAAITQPWSSLQQIMQQPLARNRLAGLLLNEILKALIEFSAQGLNIFQQEWRALDYLYNQRITVTSPQQTLNGIMRGISAHGELLLLDDHQQQHICLNGSVRLAIL